MAGNTTLSEMQLDAVGEVMNISMGSAATAVSELLNAKVWITTPQVSVTKAGELDYERLAPAIAVKIVYIKGLTGSNMMILKQDDVQLILNQLMGRPPIVSPDFEFDELNISAVSEVMNQMMGASATALSEFIGTNIDISTPTPYILSEEIKIGDLQEVPLDDELVAINFDLTIDGVIKSEFVSCISVGLAADLADKLLNMNGMTDAEPEPEQETSSGGGPLDQGMIDKLLNGGMDTPSAPAAAAPTPTPVQAPMQQMPPQQMNAMPQQMGMPPQQMGMPQEMQMPYGYGYQNPMMYQQPMVPPQQLQPQVSYQNAQLTQFEINEPPLSGEQKDNLQLLMNVPLQISVEIGSAKKKIKDILEFTQGTIIELERQAGAPVDVIVNGNLIARGDVVVIDDNFAVRITEIVKSKFIDSLGKDAK